VADGTRGLLGDLPKATPYESYVLGFVTAALQDSNITLRGDIAVEQVNPSRGEVTLRMSASGKLVRVSVQEMTGYTEETAP